MGANDYRLNSLRLAGAGFCFLVDGEPVAAGGITRVEHNRGIAWTVMTERATTSAFLMRRIHRHVKTQFIAVRKAMGLKIVSAEARADNARACQWLEYFGFKAKPTIIYEWGS
jgi:hypothetical protein